MEISYSEKEIIFEKEINSLDNLSIEFSKILNELDIDYVFISGYVSILFGRNRSSEDIDIFIEEIDLEKFNKLWTKLAKKFECIITDNVIEAYEDYLKSNLAIRFSFKDEYVPNMEVKFPKSEVSKWSLKNRVKLILNDNILYISPLELQISYKLLLGSEKDIEDARFLYMLFKDKLNDKLITEFNKRLKIKEDIINLIK
ncbi:MAG: hypothetical protein ACLFPQ_05770 [Candidatus Woesearchaeota archaeon]